jgi:hypothetical protein
MGISQSHTKPDNFKVKEWGGCRLATPIGQFPKAVEILWWDNNQPEVGCKSWARGAGNALE